MVDSHLWTWLGRIDGCGSTVVLQERCSLASLIAMAFAAVAIVNAPTADAARWRSCGDQKGIEAGYDNVYARNVGCKKARSVAYEWFLGGGSETGGAPRFHLQPQADWHRAVEGALPQLPRRPGNGRS
jgi:hypothetical protein